MTVRILPGDCREVLRELPDESVHCVVTSPPYWGLRDYGTARWEGGDTNCGHLRQSSISRASSGLEGATTTQGGKYAFEDTCGRCGAIRIDSQLGMERTLGEFVETMVGVFREVRRVLRSDGTLWINLGDSYAASVNGRSAHDVKLKGLDDRTFRDKPFSTIGNGLKPKDLCGIPWRVAFALQADGWWLRQDIIWSKPNPMPESVTDRCTKAHEYLFLLSKSERYYYDAGAIAEPTNYPEGSWGRSKCYDGDSTGKLKSFYGNGAQWKGGETRNKRSVWEVATAPFSEAHFATFPPALIEPCILAGCPEKCCPKCGAPWVRQVEREPNGGWSAKYAEQANEWQPRLGGIRGRRVDGADNPARIISTSITPSCSCDAGAVPGTCLDPFGGAGTTGLVADRLGRNAILIELNSEYAAMASRRINDDAGLFADVRGWE